MHGTLIMKENVGLNLPPHPRLWHPPPPPNLTCVSMQSLRLVAPEQALKELGLHEHQLRFTCRVPLQDPHSDHDTLLRLYTHLKRWGGRGCWVRGEGLLGGGGRGCWLRWCV